jgi:hypothetical protein
VAVSAGQLWPRVLRDVLATAGAFGIDELLTGVVETPQPRYSGPTLQPAPPAADTTGDPSQLANPSPLTDEEIQALPTVPDSVIDRTLDTVLTVAGPRTVTPVDPAAARKALARCYALVAYVAYQGSANPCELALLVPATDALEAAEHDAQAIQARPDRAILHYRASRDSPLTAVQWQMLEDPRCADRKEDQQCDEYPFRSTAESGPTFEAISLAPVLAAHNAREGAVLGAMYQVCGHYNAYRNGTSKSFAVAPLTVESPQVRSFFLCRPRADF